MDKLYQKPRDVNLYGNAIIFNEVEKLTIHSYNQYGMSPKVMAFTILYHPKHLKHNTKNCYILATT